MKELIAKSYWRSIRRGTRTYAELPDEELKSLVRTLAVADVEAGGITAEEYADYLGETCFEV